MHATTYMNLENMLSDKRPHDRRPHLYELSRTGKPLDKKEFVVAGVTGLDMRFSFG